MFQARPTALLWLRMAVRTNQPLNPLAPPPFIVIRLCETRSKPGPLRGGAAAQSATSSAHASPAPGLGTTATPRLVGAPQRIYSLKQCKTPFPEQQHPAACHGALAQVAGSGGWLAVNDLEKATTLARMDAVPGDRGSTYARGVKITSCRMPAVRADVA
jgi:hypothetical protein